MALMPVVSSADGPRVTVSEIMKSPTAIPKRIIDMTAQEMIVDQLLRQGPDAPGGVVQYHESTPLFSDDSPFLVAEMGEIPVTSGQLGAPAVVKTAKYGLAMVVSDEMIRRNNIDRVNLLMTQIKNKFGIFFHDLFFAALLGNGNVPTLAAGAAWSVNSSTAGQGILYDVAHALYNIRNADSDSSNGTGVQKLSFNPDTIVMNDKVATYLLNNPDIMKVLQVGDVANRQPQLQDGGNSLQNGAPVPEVFYGMKVVRSWRLNPDKVIFLESKTVGFISDERPFQSTAMYRVNEREHYRSDVTRICAVGIDQPKAALVMTGVNGGSTSTANF